MADKKYTININLTDGRTEKLPFTAPQGPAGEGITQDEKNYIESMMISTSADKEGNVEVGKNLDVDGDLTINSNLYAENDLYLGNNLLYPASSGGGYNIVNFEKYSIAKYQHTIKFYGSLKEGEMMFFLTCYLSTNTPIDSVQDLTTYLGGAVYQTSGCLSYSRTDLQNIISINVGSNISQCIISAGGLNLFDTYTLDQVDNLNITDDVSIPR